VRIKFNSDGYPINVKRSEEAYENVYLIMRATTKHWKKSTEWKIRNATNFYNAVGQCGLIDTGIWSAEAYEAKYNRGKNPTKDHFRATRLGCYHYLDDEFGDPSIFLDRDKLYPEIDVLRLTINMTAKQNTDVKYKTDKRGSGIPIIYKRTIDKYDMFQWYEKTGKQFLVVDEKLGFPLKNSIPNSFTAFEEKCMRHHGIRRYPTNNKWYLI
jgi:hypothetical protein